MLTFFGILFLIVCLIAYLMWWVTNPKQDRPTDLGLSPGLVRPMRPVRKDTRPVVIATKDIGTLLDNAMEKRQ